MERKNRFKILLFLFLSAPLLAQAENQPTNGTTPLQKMATIGMLYSQVVAGTYFLWAFAEPNAPKSSAIKINSKNKVPFGLSFVTHLTVAGMCYSISRGFEYLSGSNK